MPDQMTRLEVYDRLRQMQQQLCDIPQREDEWEQAVLMTLNGVLYMVQSVFALAPEDRNVVIQQKGESDNG